MSLYLMIENLKNFFELVDCNDNWKRFSNPYYYFVNKNFIGSETIIIETSPRKILNFIKKLAEINPEYLNYVKKVVLRFWVGNEHRGSGGDISILEVDKEFAEKIKIQGYFEWIDKGWGDYTSELTYDLSSLQKEVK